MGVGVRTSTDGVPWRDNRSIWWNIVASDGDTLLYSLPDTACGDDGVKTESLIDNSIKVRQILQRSYVIERWDFSKLAAQCFLCSWV